MFLSTFTLGWSGPRRKRYMKYFLSQPKFWSQTSADKVSKKCLYTVLSSWHLGAVYYDRWASLMAQRVKNLPTIQEMQIPSLGWEDPWRRKWQPIPGFLTGKKKNPMDRGAWATKHSLLWQLSEDEMLCYSLSRVWLPAILWAVACHTPLSMEFSRQEYWSGCHSLFRGIFLNQWSKPCLPHCRQILYHLSHQYKANILTLWNKKLQVECGSKFSIYNIQIITFIIIQ